MMAKMGIGGEVSFKTIKLSDTVEVVRLYTAAEEVAKHRILRFQLEPKRYAGRALCARYQNQRKEYRIMSQYSSECEHANL